MRLLTFFLLTIATLQAAPSKPAEWIWKAPQATANETAYFRTSFDLSSLPAKATLRATCDNFSEIILNGKSVGKTNDWNTALNAQVQKKLVVGKNHLCARGQNDGSAGVAALILEIVLPDGTKLASTDASWKWADQDPNWDKSDTDTSGWKNAVSLGMYGIEPWGKVFEGGAASVDTLTASPGFKVEQLYSVPKSEQGSWVCLTVDDKGRLITCDQDGGLYRITLVPGKDVEIEALKTKASHAHGVLYANKALYFVRNVPTDGAVTGLYRLRDTNGDDQFDEETLLRPLDGNGEHGPHQAVLAPDGKSIYVTCGNHTKPANPEISAVPPVYQEDHLLPRMWDANGHAKGILAPGGAIYQTDFDGKTWNMVSSGYRNQFDVAISPEGEAFTYDSDMEWDTGMPWYRPTRICHATLGSDFGWRSGSGKWPNHYLDSLPPVVDIGPGSPTGVVFGTGAKFPAKYQQALFALDWTYGTMYAIHLTPKGGSFSGEKESFVTGKPLPLTDAIIHPQDGAMYFTTGGRKTQSGLYRVTYVGTESTAPAEAPKMTKQAALRHDLEALVLAPADPKIVDQVWPHLGDNDRFVRFAARVAIEHQPVALWEQRALDEHDTPNASLTALTALCRLGDKSLQPKILKALARVHDLGLRETEALDLLRVYSLCLARMGKPTDPAVMDHLRSRFEPMYPSPANVPNKELCELLVFLNSPQVVPKTLQLMVSARDDDHQDSPGADLLNQNAQYAAAFKAVRESRPNRMQIAYAFALRNSTVGWTDDLHRQYFRWYNTANKWHGGNSFAGFLKNMKEDAMAHVPEALKPELTSIAGDLLATKKELPRADGPGQNYTVEDTLKLVDGELKGRDFTKGSILYQAGLCSTCHQFASQGGGVGPDLTGIANRYALKDLLENIIDPSKVISDQYESTLIEKKDGSSLVGRIILEGDEIIKVVENPLDYDKVTEVKVDEIKARGKYPISAMPPALLNSMNPEEVKDLLAYLLSGGDPNAKVFQK